MSESFLPFAHFKIEFSRNEDVVLCRFHVMQTLLHSLAMKQSLSSCVKILNMNYHVNYIAAEDVKCISYPRNSTLHGIGKNHRYHKKHDFFFTRVKDAIAREQFIISHIRYQTNGHIAGRFSFNNCQNCY